MRPFLWIAKITGVRTARGIRPHGQTTARAALRMLAVPRLSWLCLLIAATSASSFWLVGSTSAVSMKVSDRPTLAMFTGRWWGHTRRLIVKPNGYAKEHIDSGCCMAAVDIGFRLSRPRGTWRSGAVTATITRVRIWDAQAWTKPNPRPRVGETRTLRLNDGLLVETLTRTVYCNDRTKAPSKCGA
jgi:hypothetical protein